MAKFLYVYIKDLVNKEDTVCNVHKILFLYIESDIQKNRN